MALPHPSELACFEPRPGHSSRLAAMLSGSSGSLSGTEDSVGDAASKEAQQTGVHYSSALTNSPTPNRVVSSRSLSLIRPSVLAHLGSAVLCFEHTRQCSDAPDSQSRLPVALQAVRGG